MYSRRYRISVLSTAARIFDGRAEPERQARLLGSRGHRVVGFEFHRLELPLEDSQNQQTSAYVCNVVHNRTTLMFDGALLMPRISIAPDGKTVRTSVMLPEDVHYQVQALAEANCVSSAWIIRRAVERFLIEHKGQLELPLRSTGGKELISK